MKYTVVVSNVSLPEANRIVKVISGMGFAVPEIAGVSDLDDNERNRRHGIGVTLVGNGMRFISISSAVEWLRCNGIPCSESGLKRAVDRAESYHGFMFEYTEEEEKGLNL